VDVFARTLTWMVVVPLIGEIVGAAGGRGCALDGCGIGVDGSVAVTNAGRTTSGVWLSMPTQPEIPIVSMMSRNLCFTMVILSINKKTALPWAV